MELIIPNISKTLFFPVFQSVRDIHSGLDSKRNVRTIKSGIISDMEIVTTNTKDGIILHGQLFESPNKENIIIHGSRLDQIGFFLNSDKSIS